MQISLSKLIYILHRLYFLLNKMLELVSVLSSKTIKAGWAYYLFFKSFQQMGSFFTPNKDIYKFDLG